MKPDRAFSPEERTVSPHVVLSLLRYVETALGSEALDSLRSGFPAGESVRSVAASERWWTSAELQILAEQASRVTRDREIGRRAGQQSFRDIIGGPAGEMIMALGTVQAACVGVADYSSKLSATRAIQVVDSSSTHAILEGRFAPGVPADKFSCDYALGYFGELPTAFGYAGTVVEQECQGDGDAVCRYRIAWAPDATRTGVEEVDEPARSLPGAGAMDRLESYHEVAAQLVGATDVSDMLERTLAYVSQSLQAPRYALSAQLPGDEQPRRHWVGFQPEEVDHLFAQITRGGELAEELVSVPVASVQHAYGHLVAGFPPGSTRSVYDERVLRAYASYAASALEVVAALDAARRDRDLAQSLLDLGRALAQVGDRFHVAEQLAGALPAVVESDLAAVWLLDSTGENLEFISAFGTDEPRGVGLEFSVSITAVETWMADWPQRPFLGRSEPMPQWFGELLDSGGYQELGVVPIKLEEELVGMVLVAFPRVVELDRRPRVAERLQGLTDLAASAFHNARLVEQMRHQALHDDLTGLAKRTLLEERCTSALARRTRTGENLALVFLDLDDFKTVNDKLGHAVGDDLLRQVAQRLRAGVRDMDTCARIGGDEFAVLLVDSPSTAAALEVAERLMRALQEPFFLAGSHQRITASLGVAWAGDEVTNFEQLLKQADEAMYRAKDSGRNQVVVAA